MTTRKKTPLTYEDFNEVIMPRLEEFFGEKMEELKSSFTGEVLQFKNDIVKEVKDLREEVAAMNAQYERTNKRVDVIDTHLGISSYTD